MRSTLRAFRQVLSRDATERLAGELKWLGTVLGEARDAEVLGSHLQDMLRETPTEQVMGPVQARVQGHFASARGQARTALLAALDSRRYLSLLDQIDSLLAEPPLIPAAARPAKAVLPAATLRTYRQAARRMRRAGRRHAAARQPRNVSLHQARKAAKRARYAGEAMAPALGKKARRFAKQMKQVQSVLGEHQDAVIASRAARELGVSAHLAGESAFTYGLLHERAICDTKQIQARARRTWRQARRRRYRRWMS
jgi:CHAD domain-containing protein